MYLSSSMDEDKCLQCLFVDPLCRKPADNLHPCFVIINVSMIIQMISSQNLDDHQAHPLGSGSFLDHWPGS